jgi:hypothetical protein
MKDAGTEINGMRFARLKHSMGNVQFIKSHELIQPGAPIDAGQWN